MKQQVDITAIIYDKRGNILSIGQNSYIKTHTVQARYARKVGRESKIFLHAEIHAITRCARLKDAYRIAVFRYDSNGNPVNSKPCPICQAAIKDMTNIKVIEHT